MYFTVAARESPRRRCLKPQFAGHQWRRAEQTRHTKCHSRSSWVEQAGLRRRSYIGRWHYFTILIHPFNLPSYMTRRTPTLSTVCSLEVTVQDVNLDNELATTQSVAGKRRRWTDEMNKFILRTYLELTALDTDTKTYLPSLILVALSEGSCRWKETK